MRISLLLCCLIFWGNFTAFAQDNTNPNRAEETYYNMPRSHSFHIGAGFPNKAGAVLTGLETVGVVEDDGYTTPQFTLKYEYGLTKELGIGFHGGYYEAQTPTITNETQEVVGALCGLLGEADLDDLLGGIIDIPGCDVITETLQGAKKVKAYSVAGRIAYYKEQFPRLATYASVIAGYSFIREKNVGDPLDSFETLEIPTFVYYGSAGVRYFLSPNWGIYGEGGYGSITFVNVGLTYRILPKR